MTALRPGLPPLPARIKSLPIDARGYPTPWFVYTNKDGTRDFRVADANKRAIAVRVGKCWICGEQMGKFLSFVIGPMCAINRNTSEPACHRDCAVFSVKACPFMVLGTEYRRANVPEGWRMPPHMIDGNPGAAAIWTTLGAAPYYINPKNRSEGWLIRLGDPVDVMWFKSGRPATREEIMDCIGKRIHNLQELAAVEGSAATSELQKAVDGVMHLLPASA